MLTKLFPSAHYNFKTGYKLVFKNPFRYEFDQLANWG